MFFQKEGNPNLEEQERTNNDGNSALASSQVDRCPRRRTLNGNLVVIMITRRPHNSQTHQTESVQKSPTDAPDPMHRRRRSLLFSVHQNLAIEFSSPASLLSQLPTHLSQSFLTPSSSTVPSVRHPLHSRRPSHSCVWMDQQTRLLPTTISLAPPDHHREIITLQIDLLTTTTSTKYRSSLRGAILDFFSRNS